MKVGGEFSSGQDQGFVAGRSYKEMADSHREYKMDIEAARAERVATRPIDEAKVDAHVASFERLAVGRSAEEVKMLLPGSLRKDDPEIEAAYTKWLTEKAKAAAEPTQPEAKIIQFPTREVPQQDDQQATLAD